MTEKTIQSAMQIILHAGDARVSVKKTLDALAEFKIELAKEFLKDAQMKITEAHRIQTNSIQDETRGKTSEYSLLFAHAQDTLMTIYSEINIAKQLVKITEAIDMRISAIEK